MREEIWHIEIRCANCRFATMFDAAAVAGWLQAAGRLHRHSEATTGELRELALALAPQIPCTGCGELRLAAAVVGDDSDDWPMARRCEDCGQLISPERVEVFPDTRVCTSCQSRDEQGCSPDAPEYCPHCGSPMVVRQSRGSGIRRYVMECSGNPPCRRGIGNSK
jgi:hypothetical protein